MHASEFDSAFQFRFASFDWERRVRRTKGVRLGTVRRPPRGVKKEDFARRDYYDVWVPELAPSAPLVKVALIGAVDREALGDVRQEVSRRDARRRRPSG